jgi:hypothetical protein
MPVSAPAAGARRLDTRRELAFIGGYAVDPTGFINS